jgi:hypothetical protein
MVDQNLVNSAEDCIEKVAFIHLWVAYAKSSR